MSLSDLPQDHRPSQAHQLKKYSGYIYFLTLSSTLLHLSNRNHFNNTSQTSIFSFWIANILKNCNFSLFCLIVSKVSLMSAMQFPIYFCKYKCAYAYIYAYLYVPKTEMQI